MGKENQAKLHDTLNGVRDKGALRQITRVVTKRCRDRGGTVIINPIIDKKSSFNGSALTAVELEQLWYKFHMDNHFRVEKNSSSKIRRQQQENDRRCSTDSTNMHSQDNYEAAQYIVPEVLQVNQSMNYNDSQHDGDNNFTNNNTSVTDYLFNENDLSTPDQYDNNIISPQNTLNNSYLGPVNFNGNTNAWNVQPLTTTMTDMNSRVMPVDNRFLSNNCNSMQTNSVVHRQESTHTEHNDQCFNNPYCVFYAMPSNEEFEKSLNFQ